MRKDSLRKNAVVLTVLVLVGAVSYTHLIRLISGDTAGRMTADLTSGGEGMYFCGGQGIPIRWEKASRNDPFVYRTEDGQLL